MTLNIYKSFALVTGTATLLLGGISSASAFTVYTNRAAWEVAITANPWYTITTDTFSNSIASAQSITLDSGIVSTNSGPITLPNPPFNNNSVGIVNPGVYDNATQAGNGTASNTITWQFPSPNVWAFGADFISPSDGRLTLSGNFDGTGDQTITVYNTIFDATGLQDGFLGVVGTAEFSSVVFGNNITTVDSFSIDNASFATKHTPEPSSIVALALVGGGLLLSKRFKRG